MPQDKDLIDINEFLKGHSPDPSNLLWMTERFKNLMADAMHFQGRRYGKVRYQSWKITQQPIGTHIYFYLGDSKTFKGLVTDRKCECGYVIIESLDHKQEMCCFCKEVKDAN